MNTSPMLPFPALESRGLSMRDQVINRILEIRSPWFSNRAYLESLPDHALLQSLETDIQQQRDRWSEYEAKRLLDEKELMIL